MPEISLELAALIAAISTIISTAATIILNHWLEINKEIKLDERQKRIDAYVSLLEKSKAFYKTPNLPGTVVVQMKDEFFNEQRRGYVYLPDKVSIAIKSFLDTVKVKAIQPTEAEALLKFREMILAMRKDILPHTKLKLEQIDTWTTVN